MKKKTKVVAMYLPQYHRIPENDIWWGEGYTDWKAVKDAKPLFKEHNQPRIPKDGKYYDLSQVESIRKQAELANKYDVYGFGIYHYWFSSEQVLLDKPAQIIKEHKDINTHFFFMWDNGSWKRTWSNVKFSNSWAPLYEANTSGPEILAQLEYGDEVEWKKHFDYLLPYFKDERYIKLNGKPLFGIFNQNNEPETLKKMFKYWNKCAVEEGLNGITILGKSNASKICISDYQFDYEPATHAWVGKTNIKKAVLRLKDVIRLKCKKLKTYRYKNVWSKIIKDIDSNEKNLPGAFVRYDDTPRRGKNSSIVLGETPELFEQYMVKLLEKSNNLNKEFVFLTAWNEWGEGSYLEPDSVDGEDYLKALKNALNKVKVK